MEMANKELEELDVAATPGRWEVVKPQGVPYHPILAPESTVVGPLALVMSDPDARFICALVNAWRSRRLG